MHLASLVDMIESGFGDRPLLGSADDSVTGGQLALLARTGAAAIRDADATAVVYVGENHALLPVALLAAVSAGVPFVPVNYRLEDRQIGNLVARQPGALVLADARFASRVSVAEKVVVFDDWLAALRDQALTSPAPTVGDFDGNDVAVVLFTSGTTTEPKAALLRHRHLTSYLFGSVEFGGAGVDEAALIAVPPYHVAGIANMLSNLFAGRRLVYLRSFDAVRWLETVRSEGVTNAMVVPTMLSRIVDALGGEPAELPSLRSLSYGGAKVSSRVLGEALRALPDTDFVNAYGLTETASTVAVLSPDDHRAAVASEDPEVARRLASAGRILPTVEIEIRDEFDVPLPAHGVGMIYVRGAQVSGEYEDGSALDADGWFCTRDRGWVDQDGYLFIEGRADDTIIRGGENIAPAEIEHVLLTHPAVAEACVIGLSDEEWGQRIAAVVVVRHGDTVDAEELRSLVRRELRGSKTPDEIVFRDELPHTETGKLLRRAVVAELSSTA